MTKTEITKELNLVKKYGYKLITFQTDRRKRIQEADMTDYHITGHGYVLYIESKIGKDTLRPGQIELLKKLDECSRYNPKLFCMVITEKNYKSIIDAILSQKNESLRTFQEQTMSEIKK